MKIIGIGDLLIPQEYIEGGFQAFKEAGHQVETVQWNLESYEELQNINLKVELGGSEVYEVTAEMLERIRDAEVLITQFFPISKKVIDACQNLKIIGVLRGGYENVNVEYATEKGILVYNTPGRNSNAVADYTVGMMLSECRNIAKSHRDLKAGKWIRDYDNAKSVPDLCGKTVGIIGFGEVGRKVAKRVHSFDMDILVYDPYIKDCPDYVKTTTLPELMKASMFITLHSRLTPENQHFINKELLSMMREDAYLINTARSGLIDEAALYEVLSQKRIAGAALDVFDVEPPTADYPLVKLDNVTVTPHLAGGTVDAFLHSPVMLAEEMIKILNHTSSRFIINPIVFQKKWQV